MKLNQITILFLSHFIENIELFEILWLRKNQ